MRGWQILFGAAALYNLAVGLPGLLASEGVLEARLVALFVACFGVLYALVARDPLRLGPALWAGVTGKLGVIALMLPAVLSGTAQPGLGLILAGDALFTLGFLAFLLGPLRRAGRR
jgi:hypothetical protein